ncbi:MFS transporter [Chitinimonas koreensis]|uniref:MFS transporter n=1 Tax=Chitinimonas koreensis TaxID=356302 RepID=UPI00223EFFF9|nr:MFS transporter [Chitinimonas koreensis]
MTSTLAPAAVARPLLRLLVVAAMTLPMLILYAVGVLGPSLQRDLGIGLAAVGLLPMSCFGLAALLSLGAGQVVVRLGSQRALALLFASVALAYALLAGLPGLGGVIAAIAVCGLAQALANPVTNLLIAEQVPPAERAGVVGLKQSGVQLAALLAGLLLPTLSLWLGWRGALAGLALPALLLAAAALATLPPATAAGQPWRWLAPNRPLRLLMGVQLCAGIGLSAFVTYLPTFAAGGAWRRSRPAPCWPPSAWPA